MKKTCIFLFLMISAWVLNGQNPGQSNQFQENAILIKGTKVSMVPPLGFVESTEFKGFKHPGDPSCMIMITEIPGLYSEVVKGFSAEKLASSGMKLNKKEEKLISGQPASWMEINQSSSSTNFSKIVILTSQSNSSLIINGVYPRDSVATGELIRQSLLTLSIDTSLKIDPRNELDYSLYEKAGQFIFVGVMGNGMLFNRDGLTPTRSADKTMLITDKSYSNQPIPDRNIFSISRLGKYPQKFEWLKERGIVESTLDGLDGMEIYGRSTLTNEDICQLILFGENGGYYLLVGTYPTNRPESLKDIKAVFQSFKRK
ncbi:MAG: hypothetical protein IPH45_01695 [Bacteroidales bacterium]|nr:hypothetical protein [Bacteroidales bacterium]